LTVARNPLLALHDIRDAIRRIEHYTEGMSSKQFDKNELVRDAVERRVEIISEASRRIPADLKAQHREIPWPKIAGVGNVLRHDYDEIYSPLIWEIVEDHLPALKRAVAAMIREAKKPTSKK